MGGVSGDHKRSLLCASIVDGAGGWVGVGGDHNSALCALTETSEGTVRVTGDHNRVLCTRMDSAHSIVQVSVSSCRDCDSFLSACIFLAGFKLYFISFHLTHPCPR